MMLKTLYGVGLSSLVLVASNVDSAVVGSAVSCLPSADKLSIVMSGSSIAFSGTKVQLGQALASWQKAIPGAPRCTDERVPPVMCTWDQIGLEVGTDDGLKNVKFANLFLLTPEVDSDPLPPLPDGSPAGASTVTPSPKIPFSGFLQIDGVEITGKMNFSKVRASIDQRRNVRCGSLDCSNPHGSFGNGAKIFFALNGRSECDSIARIGLSLADGYR